MHGLHQEAQKLRTIGVPRSSASEIRLSASAGRTRRGHISGRFQMTGRSNAGATGRSPRLTAATRLAPFEPERHLPDEQAEQGCDEGHREHLRGEEPAEAPLS